MVNPVHNRFAVRHQTGDDQAGRSAQIGGHHSGARQFFHAAHHGGIAFHRNVRAHAVQLGNVHEAVFKNGFHHFAAAFSHGVHRHKLRLHIGGEGGMFGCADIHGFGALLHINADPVAARFDDGTGFHQLVQHHLHGVRRGIAQYDFATRHGHGAQERACFNTVGHHAVFRAVQFRHAFHRHGGRADALNFRAHFHQAVRQIHHFGFHSAVFQHGGAFGQRGRHQQVFRATHGHHVHHHARAFKFAFGRGGLHITMFNYNMCAHCFQPFQMLVHRTRADGTAAGQAHFRFAEARQCGAQHQNRSAHGAHQIIRRAGIIDRAAVDFKLGNTVAGHRRTHALQQFFGGFHVGEHRHIGQAQRSARQQTCAHQRQGGIFRARYHNFAVEFAVAGDS